MKFLTINGKRYPLHASWRIIRGIANEKGITKLISVGEVFSLLTLDETVPFVFDCLKAGAKRAGKGFDITVEDLEDQMDLEAVTDFMNVLAGSEKTDEAEGKPEAVKPLK
jgi:hypothetical protein